VKEVNFINELEIGMKRADGEKKIKKYEEKTEKHTLSLEEQKELKVGSSRCDFSVTYWF